MKKSVLLYLLSILVFMVSCGADDPAASEALSTKVGFYQSGSGKLMLEIQRTTGDVYFSITGDFKDATRVINAEATDNDKAKTFQFKKGGKDYTLTVGDAKAPSSVKVGNTTLTRIDKPLSLAKRAGTYTGINNPSFSVVVGTGTIQVPSQGTIKVSSTSTVTTFQIKDKVSIEFISATQVNLTVDKDVILCSKKE